jgi:hypothetical protein
MELQAWGPGAGMIWTAARGQRRGWEGGTADGLERSVVVAHALVGRIEAHEGRGVRNTADAMTMVGAWAGDHDVSKSRQNAAS